MGIFKKYFSQKNNIIGIEARRDSVEIFKKLLIKYGLSSFEMKVGDKNDNNLDRLYLFSKIINNPDINTYLNHSLLKAHTANNLISIGFNKIVIIEEGNDFVKILNLEDYTSNKL